MKMILLQSRVLSLTLFSVFNLLIVQLSVAQDCVTEARSKPSLLVTLKDNVVTGSGKMNAMEMAKIKPYLSRAEKWVKTLLTGFTGAKLVYANNYFPKWLSDAETTDPIFITAGIKGFYQSAVTFFQYYCYDNKYPIETEVESASFVRINFNNVFAFKFSNSTGVYTVNGKPAFTTIQKKRSEGRVDYYELLDKSNTTGEIFTSHEYILLRNSDKPIFIPITRKEYLEQMLKDADTYASSISKFLTETTESNKKIFELEMKIYKEKDKSYTPEKEAKRRKWFEEDQEKTRTLITKKNPETAAGKEVILQYLQKPTEWLNRTVKDFYSFSSYSKINVSGYLEDLDRIFVNGVGEKYDHTATEIVTINPTYFNNKLSTEIPQVIMICLYKVGYPHMEKFTALINKPGALAPLEALLNSSKTALPILAPTKIVSAYSLKYLPKLKTLKPLVVPVGMKPSVSPVTGNNNSVPTTAAFNFTLPPLSARLNQLPQLVTKENYTAYIQQLHNSISNAIKPNEKKKADDYVKNKKLTQSKDISKTAFAAWLQNAPAASLYLHSKAVTTNPSDALAANNFSAFLIMGGLPEKSIPILEYWNKQKPGESTLLGNLGNAYYRLGSIDKAMNYLLECVKKDSLHPTANKILCIIYLKKGDTKSAKDHGTKSLTGSYDEQVVTLLKQLDNKTKPGDIMARWKIQEFPMLKRMKLLEMPSKLDDMDRFIVELEAEKKSLEMTIEDIENKVGSVSDEVQQKILMGSFTKGFSSLRVKAQYIITDAMQNYQREKINESEVLKYHLNLINKPFYEKIKLIEKKYASQLSKLEGGENGDEAQIAAVELERCKTINTEKELYLGNLSKEINNYAQRQEYISRKFYAVYAIWAPFWMPETTVSFPSIEKDYLKDIQNILSQYTIISKNYCVPTEPLAKKEGKLKNWEDEFCANFKFKYGFGPVKVFATCNSWGIEGGEGVVGDLEVKYNDDGSFAEFTVSAGFGETWAVGKEEIAGIEASASIKEFIKFGKNGVSKEWEIKDFGLKAEITLEGRVGKVSSEIKILEASASVNAGLEFGGVDNPLLFLK